MAAPNVELVAACDIDGGRLDELGRRYEVSHLYSSYEEMLHREEIDLLVIASWTSTHAPIVLEACKVGIRGILCEKPISTDLAFADAMVAACRDAHVPLVINHERRFDRYYRKAREIIQTGEIGELRTIIGNVLCRRWAGGRWKDHPELSGGGPLLHDGTHLIDMMRFLSGDIGWVSADVEVGGVESDVEITAAAMLRFRNGVIGFIEAGGDREYFNFELDIQGSHGRIRIGNGIIGLQISGESRMYTGFEDLLPAEFPAPSEGAVNPFAGAVVELIECVQTGRTSLSSGEDGRAALEVINAIYRSASSDGRRITLPLVDRQPAFQALIQEKKTAKNIDNDH